MTLTSLLNYLSSAGQLIDGEWNGWQIKRAAGGSNGLVYRVARDGEDYAIKFTLRDQRQRARREFQALTALHQAGLNLAPKPILLDTDHYPQDMIVQSWLIGDVIEAPPDNDADWQRLIDHFTSIHHFTPNQTIVELPSPVLNCQNAAQGIEVARWQMLCLPELPPELRQLFDRLENKAFPDWPQPTLTLCRTDPNTRNFVRRADGWRSVDWENSGWGDPAFEIADMMIHPAYMTVPSERWEWVINYYLQAMIDPAAEVRIRTYYHILAVWWVARMARFLYEVPRGLDQRLAERSSDWQLETQRKYDHYLNLAQNLMEH